MHRYSLGVGSLAGAATAALLLVSWPHHASAQDTYVAPDQEAMQALLNARIEEPSEGVAENETLAEDGGEALSEDPEHQGHAAAERRSAAGSSCGAAVTVAGGDTLSKIARRCDVTVEALMDANEHISDPHRISIGLTLTMPGGDATASGFVVGPGDTLASIAGELRLPARALAEANPELDTANLPPGAVLRVPPDWADDFDAGEGPVTMTGVITTVQCPAMRGTDGRLYALAGMVDQFQPGDRVEVQGQRAQATWCVPGAGIEIGQIRPSS